MIIIIVHKNAVKYRGTEKEMQPISAYLNENFLICDGAFGTYYAEKYNTKELPELANLSAPERVREIHEEYVSAGAKLIRTNTFAAHPDLLNCGQGLLAENVKSACRLAKEAADGKAYVAGDIGPVPAEAAFDMEAAEKHYLFLAKLFAESGVDAIVFETFSELETILPVIRYIKEETPLFVIVQFAVSQYGYSSAGLSMHRLFEEVQKSPADAYGLNCGIGPGHMASLFQNIKIQTDKYITALPNAGYPHNISNRMVFSADNGSYFAERVCDIMQVGADIAGGCCGTTPEHIRRLSAKTAGMTKTARRVEQKICEYEKPVQNNAFYRKKEGTGKKLIAVELAPPLGSDDKKLMEAAHALRKSDVDVLTFPDSPSGRTRVDSILMAEKVSKETGMCVMPHLCCRDKNAIAMRSQLLGAHINGINNFLVVTGDPVPAVARQTVKAVFNFNSIGLMNIIHDMNTEQFADSPVVFGGAINQNRRNLNVEIDRIRKKMEMGADFFFTQPVFTEKGVNLLRRIKEETGARILCGVMPFVSRRNAVFMKNEMTGIEVDEQIIARYPENGTKEEGEAVGIEIAREVMAQTADFVDGYYFSFPFNRVYLLEKILQL